MSYGLSCQLGNDTELCAEYYCDDNPLEQNDFWTKYSSKAARCFGADSAPLEWDSNYNLVESENFSRGKGQSGRYPYRGESKGYSYRGQGKGGSYGQEREVTATSAKMTGTARIVNLGMSSPQRGGATIIGIVMRTHVKPGDRPRTTTTMSSKTGAQP